MHPDDRDEPTAEPTSPRDRITAVAAELLATGGREAACVESAGRGSPSPSTGQVAIAQPTRSGGSTGARSRGRA